jgi:membrane protein DedA with SNARE-associated domain
MAIKLLSVFLLAAAELWVAIPTGLALKINPLAVSLICAAGAISGSLVVCLIGAPARAWLASKFGRPSPKRKNRWLEKIWNDHGVLGLGLIAPLLTGAPLGTAVGIALGANVRRLLLWISIGTLLWSVLFTYAGALGFSAVFKHVAVH